MRTHILEHIGNDNVVCHNVSFSALTFVYVLFRAAAAVVVVVTAAVVTSCCCNSCLDFFLSISDASRITLHLICCSNRTLCVSLILFPYIQMFCQKNQIDKLSSSSVPHSCTYLYTRPLALYWIYFENKLFVKIYASS